MLLTLSLLALALPPQDSPRDSSAERPQNRILFCHGGAVLRGLTRRAPGDAGWELRRDGKWTAVPDRLVASDHFRVIESGTHHTALSAVASDHLPITAILELPEI